MSSFGDLIENTRFTIRILTHVINSFRLGRTILISVVFIIKKMSIGFTSRKRKLGWISVDLMFENSKNTTQLVNVLKL